VAAVIRVGRRRGRVRRCAFAILAILAAPAISGCGSDREVKVVTATVTSPIAQVQTTTQAATSTGRRVAPQPQRTTSTTPHAKPTPKSQVVSRRNPSGAVPLKCLRHAGLFRPARSGPTGGLWGGKTPTGGQVLVDGPYKTAREVRESVDSLDGVSIAEAGGRYVASAALTSKLGPVVSEVAKCLKSNSR
jgi:hypothetical protein